MPPSPGWTDVETGANSSGSNSGSQQGSPVSNSGVLDNLESVGTLSSSSTAASAAAAGRESSSADAEELPARETSFQDVYRLENVIDSGSYSSVYRCVSRQTSENFAVKVINDKMLSSYQRQLIRNEEAILRRLDHRNIIRLVAVFSNEPDMKRMVFEFADQLDVCLALVTSPNFGEMAIRSAARQLFSGLVYLHRLAVVHRDLKLENLLVKSDVGSGEMVLKISDFGYAVELASGQTFFTMKNTIIGSFEYMSPELIRNQEYSAKIDCWAAGVIIYFLFTGDFPFRGANVTEMARCIIKRQFALDFAAPEWTAASLNAVGFISSILSPYCNRPNASQLLKHAWLSASAEDPRNRTTDQPLPIMRQRERLEFLQHEAEMKQKRLYNNSSSDKMRASPDDCRMLMDGSCYLHRRRRRHHCWHAGGSHEAVFASEFHVNSAMINGRRRCRSLTAIKIKPWTEK